MEEDREMVKDIVAGLDVKLRERYGYCGVMEGGDHWMLNSGNANIIIRIELKAAITGR